MTDRDNGSVRVTVDLAVYDLAAVKAACYQLADRAVAILAQESEGQVVVTLEPGSAGSDCQSIRAAFYQALLDEDLRWRIARATEALRNLIVAHALSEVPLLHPDEESADYK